MANKKLSRKRSCGRNEVSSTFLHQGKTPEGRALSLQKETAVFKTEKKLEMITHNVPCKIFGVDSVQE